MQQAVAALLVLALISSTSAFHVPALCLGRASSSLACGSPNHHQEVVGGHRWTSRTPPDLVSSSLWRRFPTAPVGHARPLGAGAMSMSLCEDQEEAVVRRGELEEQLMSGAPTGPLQAPPLSSKRAAGGGGGGFSAAQATSKKKSSIPALHAQGKAFAKVMRKDGVCLVPDVLQPAEADA